MRSHDPNTPKTRLRFEDEAVPDTPAPTSDPKGTVDKALNRSRCDIIE